MLKTKLGIGQVQNGGHFYFAHHSNFTLSSIQFRMVAIFISATIHFLLYPQFNLDFNFQLQKQLQICKCLSVCLSVCNSVSSIFLSDLLVYFIIANQIKLNLDSKGSISISSHLEHSKDSIFCSLMYFSTCCTFIGLSSDLKKK